MCRISMYQVFKSTEENPTWYYSKDIDFSKYEKSFAVQGHKAFLTLENVFALSRGIGAHSRPAELVGKEISRGDIIVRCSHTDEPRVFFNEKSGFRDITEDVDTDIFPCSMLTAATAKVVEYNKHSLYLATPDMKPNMSDYELEVERQLKYWEREKYKLFLDSSALYKKKTRDMKDSQKERYMRALITQMIKIKKDSPHTENDRALLAALDNMPEYVSA